MAAENKLYRKSRASRMAEQAEQGMRKPNNTA
jgi:hypothetical protein